MADHRSQRDALFVVYAHSRPGVLAKLAGAFYRRGLDIRTLTVGATREPELAKIVLRVVGSEAELQRIAAAIGNLVDVLAVELADLAARGARELCLVRVATRGAERDAVLQAVRPFGASMREEDEHGMVLELAGAPARLEQFLAALDCFTVLDISRTGATTPPGLSSPSLRER
jgi:acetolactate synthase I/III small subunit